MIIKLYDYLILNIYPTTCYDDDENDDDNNNDESSSDGEEVAPPSRKIVISKPESASLQSRVKQLKNK